jgi:hypothetical protein
MFVYATPVDDVPHSLKTATWWVSYGYADIGMNPRNVERGEPDVSSCVRVE